MTYNNRGSVYHTLGQHRRAIQDCDEAIRLNPQLAAAYNNRGGAYARLGQAANSKADQEKNLPTGQAILRVLSPTVL